MLGACSSIYDKWLLQYAGFHPATMQAWFTVYLVPVMIPLALSWYRSRIRTKVGAAGSGLQPNDASNPNGAETSTPSGTASAFQWRRSILFVSPLLIAADWFYFVALSDPDAMISVVSVIRRCSVMVALAFAARTLSEKNLRAKLSCVAIILVGVAMLTIFR